MTAKTAKAPTKKSKTTKQKPEVVSKVKTVEKKPVKDNLRAWNIRFGIVLIAEAVAVVVAGSSKTVELTNQFLAKDALATEAAGTGTDVLATATRHITDVRLSWIVAGFLLLFAATFLIAATVWRRQYEAWLERGVNRLRWVALGLGGGAIVTAVAMLSGVTDVSTLSLVFGSVVLAAIFALAVELIGGGRRLRRLLAAGAILGIFLPWLIFVCSVSSVIMHGGNLPAYLYYVYSSVTLLLIAFGLATYFRIKQRGKWSDTFYTEKMFMILGFAASTILALQIFSGALQS